ncbi:MAG: peptidoglycan-binding domain-containing protein [Candidatus Absconditabacterales bacterium]
MKITTKKLIFTTLLLFIFACFAFADTGTNLTGTSNSIKLISGSLLDYSKTQKDSIITLFDATYKSLNDNFQKSGLALMQSVEYQSLICLGAMQDNSILSQMQKEKESLKIALLKNFVDLENQINSLEEKNHILKDSNINLFDGDSTYETEKIKLQQNIDDIVNIQKGFIINFQTIYQGKIKQFVSDFAQYYLQNKDLIKTIGGKITKIQSIISGFNSLNLQIKNANDTLASVNDFMEKLNGIKISAKNLLDTQLQSYIQNESKKRPKLTNLTGVLLSQKDFLIGSYVLDFDEQLASSLQNWYDYKSFLSIKKQIDDLKNKYIKSNKFNCSTIGIDDPNLDSSLSKIYQSIQSLKNNINSGLSLSQGTGNSNLFKNQLLSGFNNLFTKQFSKKIQEFKSYSIQQINNLAKNITDISDTIQTTTGTNDVDNFNSENTQATQETKSIFIFTKPFNNNQKSPDIKILQKLLNNLGFYTGNIDGVYSKSTRNAVYAFQIANGLLKGYEKSSQTRGWMGPATRKALNEKLKD